MKPLRIAAAAVLLFACDTITEPTLCACSPPGGGTAVITGTVLDPATSPVVGATVQLRVMNDESCEEPPATLGGGVASGAGGRFRHTASWSGGRKCFRVWAEPPQGSTFSASESQFVRIDYGLTVTPDSVELALRLR
jgi:hypothetical protein